jgi:hypothetical protein
MQNGLNGKTFKMSIKKLKMLRRGRSKKENENE